MVGAENVLPKGILIASLSDVSLLRRISTTCRSSRSPELIVRTLQALGAASLVLALVYFWFPFLVVAAACSRSWPSWSWRVLGWRVCFDWLTTRLGQRERLLLVGTQRRR